MKKLIATLLSLTVLIISVNVASFAVSAEEDTLNINNNAEAKVGDKVKYTLYLADTTEIIIGFELRMFYDSEYLKYVDDSLSFEKFDGVVYNTNLENKMAMSWTNVIEGVDFSEKGMFLSAEFEVVAGGDTEISQFITEIYGDDMTYLKSFTWTYELSTDGEVISDDVEAPPVVSEDEETLSERQGAYINYVDGKGEENYISGSGSGAGSTSVHEAVVGNYRASSRVESPNKSETQYVNVAKDKDKYSIIDNNSNNNIPVVDATRGNASASDNDFPIVPVVAGCAVLVIVIAGVAFALLKRKSSV